MAGWEFFCCCSLPLFFKVEYKHGSGAQYRVFSLETKLFSHGSGWTSVYQILALCLQLHLLGRSFTSVHEHMLIQLYVCRLKREHSHTEISMWVECDVMR